MIVGYQRPKMDPAVFIQVDFIQSGDPGHVNQQLDALAAPSLNFED